MSLSLSDFRRLLRKGLGGLDSSDLSNDECDEYLNIALWDIEDKFSFEIKKTYYETSLVADQFEYDLSSISQLDAIRSVSYIDEQGEGHTLDRMMRRTFDNYFNDGSISSPSGFPEFYLREGLVLYIWPPPTETLDGNSLRLALWESIASVVSGGTGLPRNWDQLVLRKAIEFGHFLNQDYEHAKQVMNIALGIERGLITTQSKEEADSHHAGLQVLWDAPRED